MTKFDVAFYDEQHTTEIILCFNGRVMCFYDSKTKTCRSFQSYMLIEEYDKYVASLEHECKKVYPHMEYKQKTSFGEFTLILTYDLISIFLDDGCTITQFKYR